MANSVPSKTIVRRQRAHRLAFDPALHPVLAQVFASRRLAAVDEIEYSTARLLPAETLLGINEAVDLLVHHIEAASSMLIVADFDADGATSCAVAMRGLRALGADKLSYIVPNRFEYGYGLTPEIVAVAAKQQPALLITVDNGISSIDGVAAARSRGIDVLITDHHLPGQHLPAANAIVNPNQPGDTFASKSLAGVGVMFYLLLALRARLRETGWFSRRAMVPPNLAQLLDLVALGTVADVVPLDYNNRILVEQGMRRIRAGQCCAGITALLQIAGRNQRRLSTSDLGFAVGPRLNAAGRLQDMSLGIECLLCDDAAAALHVAQQLDDLNKERRQIEATMREQALEGIESATDGVAPAMGVCVYQPDWHQGVVGLVAARMREYLHRPVIAFARCGEGELKGSARSIPGLHIRDTLDTLAARYPGLIVKFGGHAMAAGLSLREADYSEFSRRFDDIVAAQLSPEDLEDRLYSDGELAAEYLNAGVAELLRLAAPWGQQFPEPVFDGVFRVLQRRVVGDHHLKLVLEAASQRFDAIAFNTGEDILPDGTGDVHLAYRLDVNDYRGQQAAQLIVEHIAPLPTP